MKLKDFIGFLFACLLGTGGQVMGIVWAFEALQFQYASQVLSWTMYGASTIPTLRTSFIDILHIVVVTVICSIVYGFLSAKLLKEKDI